MGGICLAATTSLQRCNTFSQPGNQLGGCSSLASSSSAASKVTSLAGESTHVGWTFWGLVSPDCVAKDSLGRATLLKMASSGKET